jgi:hypothetical protein
MYVAVTVTTCQRDACQHQGYTSEHHGGDALAENQDAEHDRNDGQQVGHCRGDGRALSVPAPSEGPYLGYCDAYVGMVY